MRTSFGRIETQNCLVRPLYLRAESANSKVVTIDNKEIFMSTERVIPARPGLVLAAIALLVAACSGDDGADGGFPPPQRPTKG